MPAERWAGLFGGWVKGNREGMMGVQAKHSLHAAGMIAGYRAIACA